MSQGGKAMKEIIKVHGPLGKQDVKNWEIGDIIEYTGDIYTARDAAHKRMQKAVEEGTPQVMDFADKFVFYAGPCPTPPGRIMGSIAPTTAARMDGFVEMTLKLGMLGMIGKGDRAPHVAELCKEYGGVYLLSIGGASTMISNQVRECEVVAYEDLGPESIKRLRMDSMLLVVGIDVRGRIFWDEQIKLYRRD